MDRRSTYTLGIDVDMNLNLPDQWDDEENVIQFLAEQLTKGRLALFLGAGISQFYGLPAWRSLIDRLSALHGEKPTQDGEDLVRRAGHIRAEYYSKQNKEFLNIVHKLLYTDITLDYKLIRSNELLSAIGALVMSSTRGRATKVFTLNFDDLLENYLEFHGFTTAVVHSPRHWNFNDDVVIYHPHGFLPLGERKFSDDIILGTIDYFDIMKSPAWQAILKSSLRTHTFLFIGLSGDDMHLQSLLSDIRTEHAAADERLAYHSVRFCIEGKRDELRSIFKECGIYTKSILNYSELPDFLFKICQQARTLRVTPQ